MLKKILKQLLSALIITVNLAGPSWAVSQTEKYDNTRKPPLLIADPFVLKHEDKYYLYGTNQTLKGENNQKDLGFKVFISDDLVNWSKPAGATNGFALVAKNSWGNKMFWAPEVIFFDGRFIMYYTVEEHLAIAESNSPSGPFVQKVQQPMHLETKEIDPHVFIDDNGKAYLYFVRFTKGNEIWCAELNPDMLSIKEDTITHCIGQSQEWEKSNSVPAAVNEGAFVFKHKNLYYLTYSANHYQSLDYGVGYATAKSPLGPWQKYNKNPILRANDLVKGPGHHSLVKAPDDKQWFIIYHTHYSTNRVQPRKLAIDRLYINPASDPDEPDIITINGPTTTPQPMP
ncbi:MAG: glycoside hydrolase family 43 protein [Sedimentisphaerales bacterium]|nr:glycoside hydrolase family 43 protein [Sedimentisphaerales bacterium]MBN2841823.1 glycoside hydrolase family 43 protein [Sedimentisphaerales bacterium]